MTLESFDLQGRSHKPGRVYARSPIPSTHRDRTIGSHRELYEHAVAAIERDARFSGLSLERVADELAVSPRQLQRVLREVGETTFRARVLSVRMERAARLLRERRAGSVPVRSAREVAGAVGYNQPAGFAKAFRRYWGESPDGIRRRHDSQHTSR